MNSPAPTISSSTSEAPAITPLRTMRGHTNWVTGVAHLASGRRIVTSSVNSSPRLWDLESGAQIDEYWRIENHEGIQSMALSPNDKTVASGSNDGTVKLWNAETKKVITELKGHSSVVSALCWSADSNRVASGSGGGTARVWDVRSGETVLTITTGHEEVNAVMYSPDNEKIATGGGKLITTLKHDVAPRPVKKTQARPQGQTQSSSSPSQPAAASTSTTPPAAAAAPTPAPDTNTAIPGAATVRTNILRFLSHLVLFLCCAYPPQADRG